MKRNISFRAAPGALALILTCISLLAAAPAYEWGTPLDKVKSTLPSDRESTQFTPREKPKYKNKLLSYITAIDGELVDKIIIVRLNGRPVTDYLFVNNKLYTIMENWGSIDEKTVKEIETGLNGRYGQPLVQQDKNFFIYSYNSDTTKVLYYIMKNTDGTAACKVYYYTKKLFRMLILE